MQWVMHQQFIPNILIQVALAPFDKVVPYFDLCREAQPKVTLDVRLKFQSYSDT